MNDDLLIDQPHPGLSSVPTSLVPVCVELTDSGGRPVVRLIIEATSIEDLVLRILPGFYAQSGFPAPVLFRQRPLNADETSALQAAQSQ